jgi:LuxR family maltose regulon positive regulatory protein
VSGPPLRPGIVARPELVDALISLACPPVVLLSAPAGYGKTTLLALWRERDPRAFAWLSVEAADNDPVALAANVVAALELPLQGHHDLIEVLNTPDPPIEEVVLPMLARACMASDRPSVLVFDDYHTVIEKRSHTIVRYLAEHLPAGFQLAIATRTDPPLPLATWRAHGRLAEIRAAQLLLGSAEASAMMSAAGVVLTDDVVARLVQRTEGWPAALYLAALSLRDRPHPEAFVDRFTGTTRHVADFLSEDVLARQSEDVIQFLLRTCILDELNGPLCDAVLGCADAEVMLRTLERSNLFVIPLDEDRLTYRYHHLFAEYLRAELSRRSPDIVPELHRRAWRCYREHGLIARTIVHAQLAGDTSVAAELVSAEWLGLVESGKVETTRSWLRGFRAGEIESHAPLAIAAAWISALAGDSDLALRYAQAARNGTWDGPMPDGTASLESALSILSSAFGLQGVSGMRRHAQRAVELETDPSGWRALALMLLGVAMTLAADFVPARKALEEAVQLSRGETSTGTTSLAYLALISLREGDEAQAFRYAERAHEVVERPGMRNYMPSICTYSVMAHLLARRGDMQAADAACDHVGMLLPKLTDPYWWQMVETRILVAPVLLACGREQDASTYLDEATSILEKHPDAGKLHMRHADAVRHVRPASYHAHASLQLSDAERRVLRLLASDLSLREIGGELFLSVNTVKTHKRSIYRKLGVSSRSAAVSAAREGERSRPTCGER